MIIKLEISDQQKSDIEKVIIDSGKTVDEWLILNLNSLITQCSDLIKDKELASLGELTTAEIQLIKTSRIN